jgi:hypothetical protein
LQHRAVVAFALTGRCGSIVRSLQPHRAVVAAQSSGRFFCIDQPIAKISCSRPGKASKKPESFLKNVSGFQTKDFGV